MADMFHQATAGQKSVTRVVALTAHFVYCGCFHLKVHAYVKPTTPPFTNIIFKSQRRSQIMAFPVV